MDVPCKATPVLRPARSGRLLPLIVGVALGLGGVACRPLPAPTAHPPLPRVVARSGQPVAASVWPVRRSTPSAPRCLVALTFDDGPYGPPYPGLTARVLTHLERAHAYATFFLIGHHLVLTGDQTPVLLRRMQADGDTIGNHSYSHAVESGYRTYAAWYGQPQRGLLADFAAADATLGPLLGEPQFRDRIVRLPGAQPRTHPRLTQALQTQGRRVYGWDIDFDPDRGAAYTLPVVERVIARRCAEQGRVIVLTHDWVFARLGFGPLDTLLRWLGQQGDATVPLPFATRP